MEYLPYILVYTTMQGKMSGPSKVPLPTEEHNRLQKMYHYTTMPDMPTVDLYSHLEKNHQRVLWTPSTRTSFVLLFNMLIHNYLYPAA